jgi:hypothetical protein
MTYRVLISGRKITEAFTDFINEFSYYCEQFRTSYKQLVRDDMSKLQDLPDLGSEARSCIWIAVNEAARCYHATQWRSISRKTVKGCCYLKAIMTTLLVQAADGEWGEIGADRASSWLRPDSGRGRTDRGVEGS